MSWTIFLIGTYLVGGKIFLDCEHLTMVRFPLQSILPSKNFTEFKFYGKCVIIECLGKSQAIYPEALKSRTSILRKINVSFGMDVCNFEQILLHLMNNDRLYRANRSPADINIKMMEVLERRITVCFAFSFSRDILMLI